MNNQEISINAKNVKEIAEKMKNHCSDTPYHKNDMIDKISGNYGDSYNSVFELNSNTDIFVNVTRQVMECTSRFLENAACSFKNVDESLAKEVSKGQ